MHRLEYVKALLFNFPLDKLSNEKINDNLTDFILIPPLPPNFCNVPGLMHDVPPWTYSLLFGPSN